MRKQFNGTDRKLQLMPMMTSLPVAIPERHPFHLDPGRKNQLSITEASEVEEGQEEGREGGRRERGGESVGWREGRREGG